MWDIATNNLSPILDPLTIKVKIISRVKFEDSLSDMAIVINKEINNSSNLISIMMIFFRHQHILISLIVIIIFMNIILEFSTSKVDILLNY